jgi:hypothetical protein
MKVRSARGFGALIGRLIWANWSQTIGAIKRSRQWNGAQDRTPLQRCELVSRQTPTAWGTSLSRMFEKNRKFLHSPGIPPVIKNHGLTVRSLLKQTEDTLWLGLQSLQWTFFC